MAIVTRKRLTVDEYVNIYLIMTPKLAQQDPKKLKENRTKAEVKI